MVHKASEGEGFVRVWFRFKGFDGDALGQVRLVRFRQDGLY